MSKYIDAGLYVEMQIFDDEHEEWLWWKGTIEELLDQWTEQGCPPIIEVSEDCISRSELIKRFEELIERANSPYLKRGVRWAIGYTQSAPSVVPSRAEGEWIKQFNGTKCICSLCGYSNGRKSNDNYCPNCGAKMKGAE